MRTFNILEKLIVNPEVNIVPKSWIGCWMRRERFVVEKGGDGKIRSCLMHAAGCKTLGTFRNSTLCARVCTNSREPPLV